MAGLVKKWEGGDRRTGETDDRAGKERLTGDVTAARASVLRRWGQISNAVPARNRHSMNEAGRRQKSDDGDSASQCCCKGSRFV